MQRSLPVLLRRAARRLDTKSFSSSSSPSSSSPSPPSSSRVTLGPKLPGGAPAQLRKLDKLDAETRALLDAAGMSEKDYENLRSEIAEQMEKEFDAFAQSIKDQVSPMLKEQESWSKRFRRHFKAHEVPYTIGALMLVGLSLFYKSMEAQHIIDNIVTETDELISSLNLQREFWKTKAEVLEALINKHAQTGSIVTLQEELSRLRIQSRLPELSTFEGDVAPVSKQDLTLVRMLDGLSDKALDQAVSPPGEAGPSKIIAEPVEMAELSPSSAGARQPAADSPKPQAKSGWAFWR